MVLELFVQFECCLLLKMAMEVGSVFVTGANRGIGLEFVRQLVKQNGPPKYVFATYRNKDTVGDLEEIQKSSRISKVILIQMDVTRFEDVEAAKKVVDDTTGGEGGLNLLINNAGVLKVASFPEVDDENFLFHFKNNTLGPIKVLKALLPLLQQAAALKKDGDMSVARAAVINVSSMGGSIEDTYNHFNLYKEGVVPVIGYRTSKASLNMAMRVISFQVKDQGILVVNMCPGWVRTDMGTYDAQLSTEESISAMLKTFSQLNESHNGSFMDRNGATIPF